MARALLPLLCLTLAGCLDPALAPPDGEDPPEGGPPTALGVAEEAGVHVYDARGRPWPLDAAPRRPRIAVGAEDGLALAPEGALLLEGPPDDGLLADLERPPLLAATEARRVPCEVSALGVAGVELLPLAPLSPGREYTVAVGAWVGLPAPLAVPLRVAREGAGAVVTGSWPADGTSGVPPELPLLAVHLDDALEAPVGVALRTVDGQVHPATLLEAPCAGLGFAGGVCLVLEPQVPLLPDVSYRLAADDRLRDHTGARVGPWRAEFRTATSGAFLPPVLVAPTCAVDESPLEAGCAFSDDASVALRLRATGPVRAFLEAGEVRAAAVAPRGEALLRIAGLAPETALGATLLVVDLAGSETRIPIDLATTPPLATLSVVEVRADALGPEPRQEYVEVLNYGDAAIDLEGCAIADRPDHGGDVIGAGHVLAPGARALVVADGFDPLDPEDVPVPPGVPLVRVGASIASSGLSNAGEPVFLRDPEGHRLSAAPALPSAGGGVCLVRAVSDPRFGGEDSFLPDAASSCTPGTPDRVPR